LRAISHGVPRLPHTALSPNTGQAELRTLANQAEGDAVEKAALEETLQDALAEKNDLEQRLEELSAQHRDVSEKLNEVSATAGLA
jgi:predicted nuclease with TOPRIM domain